MTNLGDTLLGYVESHSPAICLVGKDESKADNIVRQLIGDRAVFEWNMSRGIVDFVTKQPYRSQLNDSNRDLSQAIEWMLDQANDNPVLLLKI